MKNPTKKLLQNIFILTLALNTVNISMPAIEACHKKPEEKPVVHISFLGKYDTKKYDRKEHNRYNTRKSKHTKKYDKNEHTAYNEKQNKKRIKYDKSQHNTYNEIENKHAGKKHTKKHTKKYYTNYNKMP